MWVLFIIILGVGGEPKDKGSYLEKYTTEEECHAERARITEEMVKAYPEDSSSSFTLVCRFHTIQVHSGV